MFPNIAFAPRLFAPLLFPRSLGGTISGDTYQQIAIGTDVAELEIPNGATGCWIQAQGDDVRWRADGNDPSSSIGLILYDGDEPTWFSEGLSKLKFIGAGSGAVLSVQFE